MTPEQKQRAIDLIDVTKTYRLDAEECAMQMAALLQELVDAPDPEPVARVTGYYAAPTPAEAPADVARDAWYGSNPPSLFQATAIYMALLEAAPNPQKLSDERILELFYENATPDRWPFGFARAIGAAMREKGQS